MSNNKIIVVGDLHGNWGSLNTLISKKSPEIVLQCGDFGWWPIMDTKHSISGGYENNKWRLKGIKPGNSKVFWCDGNHEEFPYLKMDGKIHEMYENVFYASRGSTIELDDGRIVLFAGGAASIDKHLRTPGYDWFPEENISNEDLDRLLSYDYIDIVISHTCPTEFDIIRRKTRDNSRVALSQVLDKYKPDKWFFGHWHIFKQGKVNNTVWTCLTYPGSYYGKWWCYL